MLSVRCASNGISAAAVHVHSRPAAPRSSSYVDLRQKPTQQLHSDLGHSLTQLQTAWCNPRLVQPRAVAAAALKTPLSSSISSSLPSEDTRTPKRCRVILAAVPRQLLKQPVVVARTGTRAFSSSSSSSAGGGSSSGSDSDSDADLLNNVGVDASELGPNGELPWYFNDSNVKDAWRIQDTQEKEHWEEIVAKLQK
jgi:hypothetical protein